MAQNGTSPPAPPGNGSTSNLITSLNSAMADDSDKLSQEMVNQMMAFLRKRGLHETEEALSRECAQLLRANGEMNMQNALPTNDSLVAEFETLLRHVDSSYDVFQAECSFLLFPVFAHCYLKLIFDGNLQLAKEFYDRFARRIPSAYEEQMDELRRVQSAQQANFNQYVQVLIKNPFVVRMSISCIKQLELPLSRTPAISGIVKDRISIEQSDLISKLKSSVECQMGGYLGNQKVMKHKMMWAVVKDEIMVNIEKRKLRGKEPKDAKKIAQATPLVDRIPLPPYSEAFREEMKKTCKDISKMTLISQDSPPSICMFTALNACGGVTSTDYSDDTSFLALGYGDSSIHLFALDEKKKLKKLKEMEELDKLDTDSDDIMDLIYDENSASSHVTLTGHSGPVYSVSFSPDKRLLVSSSRDQTIRLWSLDAQRNVVSYRTSMPVWQVQFCNRGYYFCSGGADHCAALWCTERLHPLRLMPDSYGHVNCVDFHPNNNYIIGGSSDCYVRIWDVVSGTCVRTFTGHKNGVRAVKTSPDGRYVVSVGGDGAVCVWDVAYGRLAGMETRSAQATMGSVAFSRDGGAFAVSYGASNVSVYSLDNLISATANQSENAFDPKINMTGFNMFSFPTKQTPVLGLHFTRRNLLMAVGSFNQ